jgi:putative ABC transport system substrate-binding protein
MNRRDAVLSLLALGVAAGPLRGNAQVPRRIGVMHSRGGSFDPDKWGGIALVQALNELGYQEGRNLAIEWKLWETLEQIPELARELVQRKVEVIVAVSPPTIVAAKSATDRIPIVMVHSAEPVELGLVRSFNRPGGNITGLAWDHGFETNLKSLELLQESLPKLRRVALLWDIPDPVHGVYLRYYEKATPQLGLQLVSAGVRSAADLEPAFAQMRKEKAEALVVLPSAQLTIPHRKTIMALASANRIPTLIGIVGFDFPDALFQFGPNLSDVPRRAASFVDRILKGAKPGDLPIEQPNKYDLIVDLKVARNLGLTIPQSVLIRADRVIE